MIIKEIIARLTYLKIKFVLSLKKKQPLSYPEISDMLVYAYMSTKNPANKEMYSKLLEFWMR